MGVGPATLIDINTYVYDIYMWVERREEAMLIYVFRGEEL
jgi:hypothetical protein